jgi:hypothetical protein
MTLDAEAGARTLFDRTFKGTLFSGWDEQPAAFKDDFRQTALAVASATIRDDDAISPAPPGEDVIQG